MDWDLNRISYTSSSIVLIMRFVRWERVEILLIYEIKDQLEEFALCCTSGTSASRKADRLLARLKPIMCTNPLREAQKER